MGVDFFTLPKSEIALLHGAVDRVFIPYDMTLAWLITAHAMIPLMTVMNTFAETQLHPGQTFQQFMNQRLTKRALEITNADQGIFLTREGVAPLPDL